MRRMQSSQAPRAPSRGTSSHDRILRAAKSLFASKGYENASTLAIARQAGTSESQLIKHFGSKEGLLEAVFEQAWRRINARVREAIRGLTSPVKKLQVLFTQTLTVLGRDPELRVLLLLEGRHVRKEGLLVVLDQQFLEFVGMADAVLAEMRASRQLRPGLPVSTIRSALMGGVEGLLRDQLLAERMNYPARHSGKQVRQVFQRFLMSFTQPAVRRRRARR